VVPKVRNSWTNRHKIWFKWCRRYDVAHQNSERSPQWGVWVNSRHKYNCRVVCTFLWPQFCSCPPPQKKRHNRPLQRFFCIASRRTSRKVSEFAKFSRFTNYYRHWHSSLFLYYCIAMQASVISIWLPRLIRFGLIQRRPNGIIVFRQPVTSLYTTADARRLTHRVKWRQCFSPIATADKVTCALAFASFWGRWKSEQKWTKWQYAVQTRLYAQTSATTVCWLQTYKFVASIQ